MLILHVQKTSGYCREIHLIKVREPYDKYFTPDRFRSIFSRMVFLRQLRLCPGSNELSGAETSLRRYQVLSWTRIHRNLQNPKLYYHVHNSLLPVLFLSHMYSVYKFPSHFFRAHFNIIFPPTRTYTKWSLPFRFSQQQPV